ncbi:uncharacterized protein N7496_005076 [Penicillium cataractarum]|uniref:Uncharacterized protein n=1 Tax=Penicillium cataractarum TaxID=2100454 RepID=A0A9W9VD76_9EURO|nr:uncharacterized protein N7496_005076 [Penicillium cataractarum]KAJ5377667.1 hypothetical protein N7496_005076 [Penicillium cataractarum]
MAWGNAITTQTENLLSYIVPDEAIPEMVEMSARGLALPFRLSAKVPMKLGSRRSLTFPAWWKILLGKSGGRLGDGELGFHL